MSDFICVTNRILCREDFLDRIQKIAACRPRAIILREKDLNDTEYKKLAEHALAACRPYQVCCILHSHLKAAMELHAKSVHVPFPLLLEMTDEQKILFSEIGASCHSRQEALAAEQLGCSYITAGHIFETDCKKDLPQKGLDFLKEICRSVSIPVYAIGGIHKNNTASVFAAGAKGACVMSGPMQCEDPVSYFNELGKEIGNHAVS